MMLQIFNLYDTHAALYQNDNDVLRDALYLLTFQFDNPTIQQNYVSMSLSNLQISESCSKQNQPKKNIQQIRPWLYKPKKSKFGNRRTYKYNDQHWSPEQNAKYLEFLTLYIDLFQADTNKKRKYHLNRMVSKFVGSRSPIQCRSHHQRMLKTYGTLQKIVKQVSELVKRETVQVQKSVRTQEVVENEQKAEEFKMLPNFQLPSFQNNRNNSNFDVWAEDSFSDQDIINNFFDL